MPKITGAPPQSGPQPEKPKMANPLPHPGQREMVKNPPRQPSRLGRTGFGTDQSKPKQAIRTSQRGR